MHGTVVAVQEHLLALSHLLVDGGGFLGREFSELSQAPSMGSSMVMGCRLPISGSMPLTVTG
ncbi:hypothetical protein ACFY19_15460 [Streptosporangium saharense]|uniref:hypothetical protein n=1 Tax=Streptosporangium saharense TaxID=1706840 RepID=UPI0036B0515D